MTIQTLLKVSLWGVCAFCLIACSNEDDHQEEPMGTITLNMLNEENGKTELGNSDVYIDNANNFYGPSCFITQPEGNSLESISTPVLNMTAAKVAVEPGQVYQIFRNEALRGFSSGKLALNVSADYYNVYVVSDIVRDGITIGATVKFTLMDIPDNGLPENDTHIGTLSREDFYATGELPAVEIELPTDDFEYEVSSWTPVEHEKRGKKLIVKLLEYSTPDNAGFYIRIGESYTYVYATIE